MSCVKCKKDLISTSARVGTSLKRTELHVLICDKNCLSWFHHTCLKAWVNHASGLDQIDTSKRVMTENDYRDIDFSVVKYQCDCPAGSHTLHSKGGCGGKIVGMKTIIIKPNSTVAVYDSYLQSKDKWHRSWERYISDKIAKVQDDLCWKFFDDVVGVSTDRWGRISTDRSQSMDITRKGRTTWGRNNMTEDELNKLNEINERRARAMSLINMKLPGPE